MEKFGTDMIKDVAKWLIDLGENVQDKLSDDGKIKLGEYIALVVDAFPDAFRIIKGGAQLKDEWLDFSEDEKDDVIIYVAEELNLDNDLIEAKLEKGFEMLMSLDSFIREWDVYEADPE